MKNDLIRAIKRQDDIYHKECSNSQSEIELEGE
jgi:hypothetical protein